MPKKLVLISSILLILVVVVVIGSAVKNPDIAPLKSPESKTEQAFSQPFKLGKYSNCLIYRRTSLNNPADSTTLPDRSQIRCPGNGQDEIMVEILDKEGFLESKNAIYKAWYENSEYKLLLVDQNGAGSGEGIGKVLLLKTGSAKLLNCFYYTPESFTSNPSQPPTQSEIASITKKAVDIKVPNCSNYTFLQYMD
jgi:hypothetical protein